VMPNGKPSPLPNGRLPMIVNLSPDDATIRVQFRF
jgi:hypothetical protein